MDNKNILYDISSIRNTKELMNGGCDKLIIDIVKYKTMFEETKAIYNTESATVYRKIAVSYLDYVERYINENIRVCVNQLNDIEKLYQNELDVIKNSIEGKI